MSPEPHLPHDPAAAALALFAEAAADRQRGLRAPFLAAVATAARQAAALLAADDERAGGGPPPATVAAALGTLGDRHFDPAALAHLLGARPHGPALAPERRLRLEDAIAAFARETERRPVLVTLPGEPLATPAGFWREECATPIATALAWHEETTATLARSLASLAIVRGELAGEAAAEPALAADWEAEATRRGLAVPVVVWAPESALVHDEGAALLALLAAGPALQIVTTFGPYAGSESGWDVALTAIALRHAYVEEAAAPPAGTTELAEPLGHGFRHGLAAPGPALYRLALSESARALAAALAGRAITPLRCDPAAGESWSRRLTLLAPAPSESWGDGAERPPAPDEARRLSRWHALQELAGVRGEALAAVAESARVAERAAASAERAGLVAAHRNELDALRRAAEQSAVDRLVSALLDVDAARLVAPDPFAAFRGRDADAVAAELLALVGAPTPASAA